ncbi:hypothetical protein [Streptomyces sp. 6N106]|uniref:hypothetical protein n=1 Tax=Streptomyces sp. 6N106 TaxID=3457418 RepID=UPI003FD0CF19
MQGKRLERVRLVDQPPTEGQRFLLASGHRMSLVDDVDASDHPHAGPPLSRRLRAMWPGPCATPR